MSDQNLLSDQKQQMDPIAELMLERIQNLGIVVQRGSSPTHALMAEIVVLQVKQDALMMLLEEKGIYQKSELESFIAKAAKDGTNLARQVRAQMMAR